jgi:hypothetical protein
MSDRKALAREIAARTKPRLVEIEPGPRRELPTRRTIEVARQRHPLHRGGELTAIRGGRTADEYRLYLIRTYLQGLTRPTHVHRVNRARSLFRSWQGFFWR